VKTAPDGTEGVFLDGTCAPTRVCALRMPYVMDAASPQMLLAGGLVANNPTELALCEAAEVFGPRPLACLVSIGSGHPLRTALNTDQTLRFEEVGVNLVTDAQATAEVSLFAVASSLAIGERCPEPLFPLCDVV
jgi:hypothetical protein